MSRHQTPADLPLTPWSEFLANFRWIQGEHISLIGSTGGGKTTLAREILERRAYTLVCGTKPVDDSLEAFTERGFIRAKDLPLPPLEMAPKILFWPESRTVEDMAGHREKFRRLLTEVFQQGNWCVYLDELRYFTDSRYLRLGAWCELFWLQGRSLGISFVGCTQRPAFVPLAAYSEPTHLFLWRNSDAQNLKRLREIGGGFNRHEIAHYLARLPRHDVLYVNTRDGEIIRTNKEA